MAATLIDRIEIRKDGVYLLDHSQKSRQRNRKD